MDDQSMVSGGQTTSGPVTVFDDYYYLEEQTFGAVEILFKELTKLNVANPTFTVYVDFFYTNTERKSFTFHINGNQEYYTFILPLISSETSGNFHAITFSIY